VRTFVQFGAGNIGRSFVGQLFSRAGYQVVFIDIDERIIAALNERGRYPVEVKDEVPETIWVENVRGVDARDVERCAEELARCELCATAIGPAALPKTFPTIARGLQSRMAAGRGPLDIIICENMRDAAAIVRAGLAEHLPNDFPVDEMVGLIETSIGKMVPIMPDEVRQRDPLVVYAEAYNTLICDGQAFKNPIPDVPGLAPKANMKAYVDRKLFIHNLGHALCAYLAHIWAPELVYTWQAIEHPRIGQTTREGMWESGQALIKAYPQEFDEADIGVHIDDLLRRFCNKALGDTIYRVGRDLPRKLSRDDRLVGALLFDIAHGVEAPVTALGVAAGMRFRATDEHGQLYPADAAFATEVYPRGIEHVMRDVCGLHPQRDKEAWAMILGAERLLSAGDG